MSVYLHAKFEVSSIILTGFRQGVILPIPQPQKEPLKSPPRLGLKILKPNTETSHSTLAFKCAYIYTYNL